MRLCNNNYELFRVYKVLISNTRRDNCVWFIGGQVFIKNLDLDFWYQILEVSLFLDFSS